MKRLFTLNAILIYVVIIFGLISLSGCANMTIKPQVTAVKYHQDYELPKSFTLNAVLVTLEEAKILCPVRNEGGCIKWRRATPTLFTVYYIDKEACVHEAKHACLGSEHKEYKKRL